jgi:hypothetical protein
VDTGDWVLLSIQLVDVADSIVTGICPSGVEIGVVFGGADESDASQPIPSNKKNQPQAVENKEHAADSRTVATDCKTLPKPFTGVDGNQVIQFIPAAKKQEILCKIRGLPGFLIVPQVRLLCSYVTHF